MVQTSIGSPDVQGVKVLKFVSEPSNLEKLVANLDKLYTPTDDERRAIGERATQLGQQANEQMLRLNQAMRDGEQFRHEAIFQICDRALRPLKFVCPSLSRDTGADILDVIADAEDPVPVRSDLEFVGERDCEWAYVVDLDAGTLEVYSQWSPDHSDRPATRFHELDSVQTGADPIICGSWKLDELPSEGEFMRVTITAAEGAYQNGHE